MYLVSNHPCINDKLHLTFILFQPSARRAAAKPMDTVTSLESASKYTHLELISSIFNRFRSQKMEFFSSMEQELAACFQFSKTMSGLGHDTETKCGPGVGRGSGATDHMAAGGASTLATRCQAPVMNIVSCSPTCRTSTENQSSLR